jgi:hypothetical protein
MTILTFPTLSRGPSLVEWGLVGNTQTHESPFDRTTQTLEMPGARWSASVTWNNMPLADHRKLAAFLASLRGRAGRFYFSPPQGWRRSTATLNVATTKVAGAGQTGSALNGDGFPTSTVIFEQGDWISVQDASDRPFLYQVTSQTSTDPSGGATINIAPPLRSSPADNAVIYFDLPLYSVFMLADDRQGRFVHDGMRPDKASTTIEIIEALT